PAPPPPRPPPAADRLAHLVPGAGHLVHMPSHIYIRIGRYADAIAANERAVLADEAYITQCRVQGFYPALYYPHNLHFLWAAAQFDGRREQAVSAARRLAEQAPLDMLDVFPAGEEFLPTPYLALLRFGLWDEILSANRPPESQRFTTAIWHYASGTALLRTGEAAAATEALATLERIAAEPAMAELELVSGSTARQVLTLAVLSLEADLAFERGEVDTAVAALRTACPTRNLSPGSCRCARRWVPCCWQPAGPRRPRRSTAKTLRSTRAMAGRSTAWPKA
ncbi:MAG: hypothetical protein JJT85_10825, partial [Chromatiales bacterium]|nr:hypothetical protein [Chromatiales bacterium]